MNFVTRLFAAALLAGVAAGLATGIVQALTVNPLIITAEAYETGKLILGAEAAGIEIDQAGWGRILENLMVSALLGFGGGLVLAGVMVLSGRAGLRFGFLLGLAAFTAFALAPAIGLPPRPPAYPEAALMDRQIWWLGTAAITIAGIILLFNSRRWWAIAAAAALFAAPHLIGAPGTDEVSSLLPPELVSQFALWSLAGSGLFWISLGCLTGYFVSRSVAPEPRKLAID